MGLQSAVSPAEMESFAEGYWMAARLSRGPVLASSFRSSCLQDAAGQPILVFATA